MNRQKLNGYARWSGWAIVIISLTIMAYNSIVTKTVLKNEVEHLATDVAEVKQDVKDIWQHLMGQK